MSSGLYSRPLPIYNRMSSAEDKVDKAVTPRTPVTPVSPSEEPKSLADVISSSMRNGEANKPMKKIPEVSNQPMFFKAARVSRPETISTSQIENVVKLNNQFDKTDSKVTNGKPTIPTSNQQSNQNSQPEAREQEKTTPASNLSRKESLKEQYNKLQVIY